MLEILDDVLKWLDYSVTGDVRSASIDRWRDHVRRNPYYAFLNLRDTPVRYHAEALECLSDDDRKIMTAYLQSDSVQS